jgi:hypothetical protein
MANAGIEALSPGTNLAADGYGQVTVEKGGERKKADPSCSRLGKPTRASDHKLPLLEKTGRSFGFVPGVGSRQQ